MIKQAFLALFLSVISGAVCAQLADPCGGLTGLALSQCRSNQQKLQEQHLEQQQRDLQQQLQQQQERQKQLNEQQRQIQTQIENMRLQNETLRKQLEEQEKSANQAAQRPTTDYSKTAELKSWKSDNPWYGSDYAKTEFAMRYAKQLSQERPDLSGRAYLDAISAKVNETFRARK